MAGPSPLNQTRREPLVGGPYQDFGVSLSDVVMRSPKPQLLWRLWPQGDVDIG